MHRLDSAEHLHSQLARGEHRELATGLFAAQLRDILA
jgi:hypothetical protein